MSRKINTIVIHCAATVNGRKLSNKTQTAAEVIDDWHRKRGFRRAESARKRHQPNLRSIGYHYVIDTDGTVYPGRGIEEVGAHVKGYNSYSIGICLVGISAYTDEQWTSLTNLITNLQADYPKVRICGHRDLSPDLNDDGKITPNEWTKTCPGFDVATWLKGGRVPLAGHIVEG